ncbi:MAG: LuxR family transcriptional regulator [Rhizobiales bacterium]|nr:LuxR family transcriptional regulator [Hyphomicrobiales bacterium]
MEFEPAIVAIERARTFAQLSAILAEWRDASGLAHIVYHATHVPAVDRPNPVLLLTYDEAWVKRYIAQDYFLIDPVVIAGRAGFLPIDWLNVDHQTPAARHFFAEAESHGVGRHGFTSPIRGPRGERALFTVTSNETDRHWHRWRHSYLSDFHLIAHYLHDRAMEIAGLRADPAMRPLSRRERQCLRQVALGRTPGEIAHDLKLSASAIRLYLRSACRKLGCATVEQGAVTATVLELIGPDAIN